MAWLEATAGGGDPWVLAQVEWDPWALVQLQVAQGHLTRTRVQAAQGPLARYSLAQVHSWATLKTAEVLQLLTQMLKSAGALLL